jgi:hypothetical protein
MAAAWRFAARSIDPNIRHPPADADKNSSRQRRREQADQPAAHYQPHRVELEPQQKKHGDDGQRNRQGIDQRRSPQVQCHGGGH